MMIYVGRPNIRIISEDFDLIPLDECAFVHLWSKELDIQLYNKVSRCRFRRGMNLQVSDQSDCRASFRKAYIEKVDIKQDLLDKIAASHPPIQKFKLVKCTIPKEYNHRYIIDLHRFKDVCKLVFDFDEILDQGGHGFIFFHTTSNGKYYKYDYGQKLVFAIDMITENMSESMDMITIKSTNPITIKRAKPGKIMSE
jgi:hypothetical protein